MGFMTNDITENDFMNLKKVMFEEQNWKAAKVYSVQKTCDPFVILYIPPSFIDKQRGRFQVTKVQTLNRQYLKKTWG